MKKYFIFIGILSALEFFFNPHAAQACTCEKALQQLGSGYADIAGPINNSVGMTVYQEECYVMFAPGGADANGVSNWWRLYVKRSDPIKGWVTTNGGKPINFNDSVNTAPYFYEFRMVVFKDRLHVVFAESDGRGNKIIHVSRYDKSTDSWQFVDEPRKKYAHLGLCSQFYWNWDVYHWSYINYNNIAATNDALFVGWGEYNDTGNDPQGEMVIMKMVYDENGQYIWERLPTTGIKSNISDVPAGLGHYNGKLVMGIQRAWNNNQKFLGVAMYDDSVKSWVKISDWLNVDTLASAAPGLITQHDCKLYIAWREKGTAETYNLYVKQYVSGTTWNLVGSGPIHASIPVKPDNPIVLCETLLSDNNGLTLVAWHNSELYVDRFDGYAWYAVGTTGTGKVWNPFSCYVTAPSITATSYNNKIFLAWLGVSNTFTGKHLLAAYTD
jgi:hypothetical protein